MIHKFQKNGRKMVIDSNSGAVHIVDDVVYEILDFYTPNYSRDSLWVRDLSLKHGEDAVMSSLNEIDDLVKNSKLFSRGISCENISVKSPVKAMCLNIAHDCQLRCRYCFASHGDFGGTRSLMDESTAKNAIDFLILNSGNRRNLEVDFFGGEPMLNFEVLKNTVEYARKKSKIFGKNFRFTVTTNGLGLDDDKISFLNSEMNNIVMSLDGRRTINEYMRVTTSGKGCYDIVVSDFKKIVSGRGKKDYYIRGTYTKRNLDFTEDVIALYNLGFKKLSLEPAVIDEKVDYAIGLEDMEKISAEYDKLSKWVYETKKKDPELIFFHFNLSLDNAPCLTKRLKGCGCGNDYVAVTPDGSIFPCHQFVGRPEYLMGNVNNRTFFEPQKDRCIEYLKGMLKKCESCPMKPFCSPCLARSEFTSDLGCRISRSRIESALSII